MANIDRNQSKMIPMIGRLWGCALENLRVTFDKVIGRRKSQKTRFLPFLGVFRGSLKTDWQIFNKSHLCIEKLTVDSWTVHFLHYRGAKRRVMQEVRGLTIAVNYLKH